LSLSCDRPALVLQARSYVLHELSESECVGFENHLAGCPACAERVNALAESLHRLEQDAVREPETPGSAWVFGRGTEAALAAAVVVLLLGYPAFLGLHRLPQVEREARELERRQEKARAEYERNLSDLQTRTRAEVEDRWRSSVLGALNDIRHLSRPSRGGAPADRVTLRGDELLVILGVELEPSDVTDSAQYHFDIHRRGEKPVWFTELSGRQVKQSLESNGEILLPVPAEKLPAGDYELRVSGPAGAQAEEPFTRRFTVVRER